MVGESNQNVILNQIDASSFAEFEISEFEIARVDCSLFLFTVFTGVTSADDKQDLVSLRSELIDGPAADHAGTLSMTSSMTTVSCHELIPK